MFNTARPGPWRERLCPGELLVAGNSLVAATAGREASVLAVPGATELVELRAWSHPAAGGTCSRRAVSWGPALSS